MDLTLAGAETVGEDSGPLAAWPVGSIYMGVTPTSPAVLFGGGTWERWGIGRVAVSLDSTQEEFNVVEKVGGEKAHVISANEMTAHTHVVAAHQHYTPIQYTTNGAANNSNTVKVTDVNGTTGGGGTGANAYTSAAGGGNTGARGASTPMSLLQPYITCYMWKRTE